MAKCRACGKFLSPVGAVACGCSAIYHKACVAISEDAQIPSDWMCPECKCKLPKTGNVATPVKGIATSYSMPPQSETPCISVGNVASQNPEPTASMSPDNNQNLNDTAHDTTQSFSVELGLEIRLFRDELREVRQEFKDLRQEISELRSLLSGSNERIDGLEKRISALEGLKESDSSPKISMLEQTIAQLKLDINDREQDILQSDIEISNLPEVTGENPTQTVMVLATKLGLSLKQEDIVFAERIGKNFDLNKGETKKSRRLVVRLSRRQLRDEFIQSARVRRGATSADLGVDAPPRRFYVNERLTSRNRKLFYTAREAARSLQWKFTWTKRGRIYTRQGEGKPVHTIRSDNDLARVFGSSIVGNANEHRV
ncbi:uncharacterized protein LOC123876069 [Maniola jurtina]|uniref:uncharacterized protein LOC123876069 n=1 Tax=Maniola jurtina TaxID=191418 RepID=UPI001E68B90F|nr:uncharacterized protein LOC123876069 [Maniola jurtina]